MQQFICIAVGIIFSFAIGCEQSEVSQTVDKDSAINARDPVAVQLASDSQTQQQESDESTDPKTKLLDFANKFLKEKSQSGSNGAQQAQDWIADQFGTASESGSEIAEDAAAWAADTFSKLKDKGLTTADNTSDWLTEDIRNMNALKYKVIRLSLDDLEAVEEQLNDLGKLRWDCFHAVQKDGETILFLKKERRSILKNIPVRDMLKLVPLMGGGE